MFDSEASLAQHGCTFKVLGLNSYVQWVKPIVSLNIELEVDSLLDQAEKHSRQYIDITPFHSEMQRADALAPNLLRVTPQMKERLDCPAAFL